MPRSPPVFGPRNSISLRLGRWFEAQGTGWGVAAVPVLGLVLAALIAAKLIG